MMVNEQAKRPPPASSVANKSIYWHNLYNNGKFELEVRGGALCFYLSPSPPDAVH